jgi:predicted Zn finger-like uncharacterized protein
MEVEFLCSSCKNSNVFEFDSAESVIRCRHCNAEYGRASASIDIAGRLVRCMICGCRDIYVQKDFSRKVGCTIAAIGAVLAPFTKLISLFVCAAIDLILYKLLPLIEVCYRCAAIYRDFPANPDHEGFNLGINDRYRSQEKKA